MNESYVDLFNALNTLGESVRENIGSNSPVSILKGDGAFPGVTRAELTAVATALAEKVSAVTGTPTKESLPTLIGLTERIQFLTEYTVPYLTSQSNAISAYLTTLESVEYALKNVLLDSKAKAHRDSLALKRSGAQIRGMESRIKDLDSRAVGLEEMIQAIERAHETADQLPTDLETLAESQKKVSALLSEAERDRAHIETARESVEALNKLLAERSAEASVVLARCESAYSSATSLGLAAAFSERSKSLDYSMWGWGFGLIASLVIGGFFGSFQLRSLGYDLSNPQAHSISIGINLVLSILSIGGPVWFAWLSTKQIGQRFRLSEDYAFKASISRAYEGYRREAARIDPDLEKQLLSSALSRLDEQPLRLVENDSFGSPWHEFLASDAVKDAVKSVPGFVEKVTALANAALNKKSASVSAPVASNDPSSERSEANV